MIHMQVVSVDALLRCFHQVKPSVLLPQLLSFSGLNQTIDHSSQRVPVKGKASPTTALNETGSLLPTAHKVCTELKHRNIHFLYL